MMSPFATGLTFWLRGWKKLLSTKSLFVIAIVPILVSLALFGFTLYLVFTQVGGLVSSVMIWMPTWLSWLHTPLAILFGILFAVLLTCLVYLLHMIIAIPFYSVLAERTLRSRGIATQGGFSMRMIRASILKTLLFLIFAVVLFIVSFVPGLNIAALAAALLILAADIMDYSFEAIGFDLGERLSYVRKHFAQVAGMATALSVTMLVPGLALLLTPGAVVGAALTIDSRNPVRQS